MSSNSIENKKIEPLPVLIVKEEDDGSSNLKLYIKNLQRVLLDPRVIGSKLMIISIHGPQRTGKSFLMNFCIRYLNKKRIESLIANQKPLEGFSWGSYTKLTYPGLYVWSEPYFAETLNKTKVAVILLDFQGPFENRSSIKNQIKVYAFCNLLSSLQIYNSFYQVSEINLQWVALTADYANLFQNTFEDDSESKSRVSHQNIFFLLRDWSYSYEFFYGAAGGQQYINRVLASQQRNLTPENILLRKFLNSQYKDINCFLMPHPGLSYLMSETFIGKWETLSNDFQEHLHNLMKNLFSPSNIVVKEVGDQFLNGNQMASLADIYFKGMMLPENPKPVTIFYGSAKTFHYKIVYECLQSYNENMKDRHLHCKSVQVLLAFHERCKMEAMHMYETKVKFGNTVFLESFRDKLQGHIDEYFVRFYAFHPVDPVIITGMLSVIIITVVFLSFVGAIKMCLKAVKYNRFIEEIDTFIFTSVLILIIYCLGAFKNFNRRLNINTDMQNALRNQFLN